jgi:hypothetical protein
LESNRRRRKFLSPRKQRSFAKYPLRASRNSVPKSDSRCNQEVEYQRHLECKRATVPRQAHLNHPAKLSSRPKWRDLAFSVAPRAQSKEPHVCRAIASRSLRGTKRAFSPHPNWIRLLPTCRGHSRPQPSQDDMAKPNQKAVRERAQLQPCQKSRKKIHAAQKALPPWDKQKAPIKSGLYSNWTVFANSNHSARHRFVKQPKRISSDCGGQGS